MVFGHLTVVGRGPNSGTSVRWECSCDCGGSRLVTTSDLLSGRVTQCARWDHSVIGGRFGRLVVLRYAGKNARGESTVECRCDCGGTAVVRIADVKNGNTSSCGCGEREAREANVGAYRARNYVGGTDLTKLSTQAARSDSSTGLRGVAWSPSAQAYVARIALRGYRYYLGEYPDVESAAQARRAAEEAMFDPVLEESGLPPTNDEEYRRCLAEALERARLGSLPDARKMAR